MSQMTEVWENLGPIVRMNRVTIIVSIHRISPQNDTISHMFMGTTSLAQTVPRLDGVTMAVMLCNVFLRVVCTTFSIFQ